MNPFDTPPLRSDLRASMLDDLKTRGLFDQARDDAFRYLDALARRTSA